MSSTKWAYVLASFGDEPLPMGLEIAKEEITRLRSIVRHVTGHTCDGCCIPYCICVPELTVVQRQLDECRDALAREEKISRGLREVYGQLAQRGEGDD